MLQTGQLPTIIAIETAFIFWPISAQAYPGMLLPLWPPHLSFIEWQLPLLSHSKTVRIHGSIPPSLKSTVGGSCYLCSFASKGLEVLSLFSYVMAIQPVDPQNGLYSSFKNTAHISHKQQYQNIYN